MGLHFLDVGLPRLTIQDLLRQRQFLITSVLAEERNQLLVVSELSMSIITDDGIQCHCQ